MDILLVIGKVLFAYLFVTSGISHFRNTDNLVQYAKYRNLPYPKFNVLSSGILLIVAPVLFLLGIFEVPALIALAVFLFCTAFIFHPYWKEENDIGKQNETVAFNKEMSMLGLILILIALL